MDAGISREGQTGLFQMSLAGRGKNKGGGQPVGRTGLLERANQVIISEGK